METTFRKVLEHVAKRFGCTYSISAKEWTHGQQCPEKKDGS
jgi:hypothetical protein